METLFVERHRILHHSLSEGHTLFLQLGCFGLDFTSFCICISFNLSFFLYHRKNKKMKQILNTLTNSFLSVNVQIIYHTVRDDEDVGVVYEDKSSQNSSLQTLHIYIFYYMSIISYR